MVSEPLRAAPDARVIEWIDAQPLETLFLSAITVAQLRAGVALLPPGRRRTGLHKSLEARVLPLFGPSAAFRSGLHPSLCSADGHGTRSEARHCERRRLHRRHRRRQRPCGSHTGYRPLQGCGHRRDRFLAALSAAPSGAWHPQTTAAAGRSKRSRSLCVFTERLDCPGPGPATACRSGPGNQATDESPSSLLSWAGNEVMTIRRARDSTAGLARACSHRCRGSRPSARVAGRLPR